MSFDSDPASDAQIRRQRATGQHLIWMHRTALERLAECEVCGDTNPAVDKLVYLCYAPGQCVEADGAYLLLHTVCYTCVKIDEPGRWVGRKPVGL